MILVIYFYPCRITALVLEKTQTNNTNTSKALNNIEK